MRIGTKSLYAMRAHKRGFTLVELMVVVFLIGILALGGTAIMGKNTEKAKFSRAEKDLANIQMGFTQLYAAYGEFKGIDLTKIKLAGGTAVNAIFANAADKKYLQSFLSRNLDEMFQPWATGTAAGDYYQVAGELTADGKGTLVIYVPGTETPSIHTSKTLSCTVKENAYSNTQLVILAYDVE